MLNVYSISQLAGEDTSQGIKILQKPISGIFEYILKKEGIAV
jgi:hypothetical protein